MDLEKIKAVVDGGGKVYWSTLGYEVIHDRTNGCDQWLIKCAMNDYCIGLTWANGVTLNGKEEEFFFHLQCGGCGAARTSHRPTGWYVKSDYDGDRLRCPDCYQYAENLTQLEFVWFDRYPFERGNFAEFKDEHPGKEFQDWLTWDGFWTTETGTDGIVALWNG